ncbi:hypothetical protein C7212DRAFT_365601 [Tuber magnatum]|uniref:ABM domain-containing protein n=1 Tax=Tuber magnatum TaxID=42249 RepID=A0A317SGV4_9PEZI|nr:hypothetical protein C7212DRAFT_365601 [Tuber magnatum]
MKFTLLLFPILALALRQQRPRSRTGVTEHVTLNLRPGISLETTNADAQDWIFQIVGKQSGFQDGYWGLELGDAPSAAYWFFASHQEFAQSPEYPATIEKVETLASSFSAPHVPLQPFPPREVFASPIVSWVTFNLIGVANSTAATNWQATANSFLGNLTRISGYRACSSGWEVEDSRVFSALVGWESAEALGAYVIGRNFAEEFRRLVDGVAWEHRVLRVAGHVPKLLFKEITVSLRYALCNVGCWERKEVFLGSEENRSFSHCEVEDRGRMGERQVIYGEHFHSRDGGGYQGGESQVGMHRWGVTRVCGLQIAALRAEGAPDIYDLVARP